MLALQIMTAWDRIWVVGAGAVGSVLAAQLSRAGGPRALLVGRSAHWKAVCAGGLTFENGLQTAENGRQAATLGGETGAVVAGAAMTIPDAATTVRVETAAPETLPILAERDLVLLACKLTQLTEIAGWLRDRLGAGTALLAVQNGLGVDDLVSSALGRPPERGLIYFGAHVTVPGRVRYFPGRVSFRSGPAAEVLARLLEGRIACDFAADFRAAEWAKLAVNCLANPLAGILRVPNAGLADAALNPLKEALLAEVRAVAAAEGVKLETTAADFNAYITGPTGGNVPSLAIDLARGRETEIAHLNGAVVRLGMRHGIATPVNAAIVTMIQFLSMRGAT